MPCPILSPIGSLSTGLLDTPEDSREANTAHFRQGPMAIMARADSQPPCSADTYPQDRHDSPSIPNDNGFSISGNSSRTVAAVAARGRYENNRDAAPRELVVSDFGQISVCKIAITNVCCRHA